jgi:superfamily II DNA/RNA helicase
MFEKLNLDLQILRTLERMNITKPTPIQEKAIPPISEGRDVISLAETGSGKTIAYLAPVLSKLLQSKESQVLILSPTRELSTQISIVVRDLLVFSPNMPAALLIGGMAMSQQVRSLRKRPQILVATPGRLMDHVRQRTVDLKKITHLVLDEADRMFDMGFAPQVNEIVRLLPTKRQTLLFSATFSKEVRGLAERILIDPIEVEVRKNDRPPVTIEQKVIEVSAADKNDKTLDLINSARGSVVVFTRTKHRTDRLTEYLEEYGVKVARIHGDRSQGQRNKSISDFKSGEVRVLVATDLAARGLDVSSVTDVINYDIPQNADDYVHRIGRTGRAGQSGQSLTLVTREDRDNWNYIAKKMQLPFVGGDSSQGRGRGPHRSSGGHGRGTAMHRFQKSSSQRPQQGAPARGEFSRGESPRGQSQGRGPSQERGQSQSRGRSADRSRGQSANSSRSQSRGPSQGRGSANSQGQRSHSQQRARP